MKKDKSDIQADIIPIDRGENIALMEPLVILETSPWRPQLLDLALELSTRSAGFRHSLPLPIQHSLATIVRSMNCYYSNLIEGHNTHPIDIERALQGHYSSDPYKRNLQKEAKAHISVQEWIDNGGPQKEDIFSLELICELHRRFCKLLPEDLLWVEDPDTKQKINVSGGQLREKDVKVGNHIAISPGAVPRFINSYQKRYSNLGKAETIIALAAIHHRLLWIHPFIDGNGRVARLLSHAITLNVLDTAGMWSIARGLARNTTQYKQHLAECDLPRRNDLDGRGNLSEEALAEFTLFFLKTCIDQIDFMEKLMEPNLLRTRILIWAREQIELKSLAPQAIPLLESILYRGEIARGEVGKIMNVTDRHARRITKSLLEKGILFSDSPKSFIKLAFPASLANRWLPGLFPE